VLRAASSSEIRPTTRALVSRWSRSWRSRTFLRSTFRHYHSCILALWRRCLPRVIQRTGRASRASGRRCLAGGRLRSSGGTPGVERAPTRFPFQTIPAFGDFALPCRLGGRRLVLAAQWIGEWTWRGAARQARDKRRIIDPAGSIRRRHPLRTGGTNLKVVAGRAGLRSTLRKADLRRLAEAVVQFHGP
jgi:hypothetical protein